MTRVANPATLKKDILFTESVYAPVQDTVCFASCTDNATDPLTVAVRRAVQQAHADMQGMQKVNDSSYVHRCYVVPHPIDTATQEPSLFWTVYMHFLDPGNQHMATTRGGRGWAALVAILGILLLNGLLISTLINYFDRRKEHWQNGEIRYKAKCFHNNFAVVIGSHNSVAVIIRALIEGKGEAPVDHVILLTNESAQEIREKIDSFLSEEQCKKLIVYNGQLDSYDEIATLHLPQATEIYVLGETKTEDVSLSYHDAQNMKIVHLMAEILKRAAANKIVCHVLFEYQTIFSVFQFSDVSDDIKKYLDFIPFSNYEDWAQCVFVHNRYQEWDDADAAPRTITYEPLDNQGITPDSDDRVHLVVVGMSKMGIAMAIQAAQIAHYPNFCTKKVRTRITFIDTHADEEMNFFKGRYHNMFDLARHRYLDTTVPESAFGLEDTWTDPIANNDSPYHYMGENFIDIEWEFVKGSIEHPYVSHYLAYVAKQEHTHLTVAICLPRSNEALAAALYMPDVVYKNALQVLVYQRESSHIVYNLKQDGKGRYAKLRPFGMQSANFTMASKDIYRRAQLCGYVYKICDIQDNKLPVEIEEIGSTTNKEKMQPVFNLWNETTIFNKWSNIYLANSFETKLRSAKCSIQNDVVNYRENRDKLGNGMTIYSKCEHDRWNVQQLLMGFRAYTEAENNEYEILRANKGNSEESLKTFKVYKKNKKEGFDKVHLNICSFDRLDKVDAGAKAYDEAFIRSIPAILKVVEVGGKNIAANKTNL